MSGIPQANTAVNLPPAPTVENQEIDKEKPLSPAEDEEEEEFKSEEESIKKKRKHKHKKGDKRRHKKRKTKESTQNPFIDDLAESSDNEESRSVLSDAELNNEEANKMMEVIDARRERHHYAIEKVLTGADEAATGAYLKNLEDTVQQPADFHLDKNNPIMKEINLPSVSDPSLWLVRCKKGAEKLASISIMQKAFVKMSENQPLMILSATSLSSLKGYIYVEAFKEAHVRQAIAGMHCIGNKVSLVPVKEMADIYTMAKAKKNDIKVKDWIRVKSGTYAGDLGQIVEVDDQCSRATIKLIPRMEAAGQEAPVEGKKQSKTMRPPQRMFNPTEHLEVGRKRDPKTQKWVFNWNNLTFRKGFLYKVMNVKSLNTNKVTPTLEELFMFKPLLTEEEEASSEDEKINTLIINQKRSSGIAKGDKIRIVKGELKDMIGTVVSITDSLATIAPMSKELTNNLQLPLAELEKFFQPGDYVRVVHGLLKGESGLITHTDGNIVHIYSESKRQEIKVLCSDVQSGGDEKAGSNEERLKYRANDLVIYNNCKNTGVVLSVDRDFINLLDSYGEVKSVRIQEINLRKDTERAKALDSSRNSISKGDTVKVVDGENQGKKGTIVHIYKNIIFLYNPEQASNNGLFVDKTRNIVILGAELLRGNKDLGKERRGKGAIGHPRKDELYNKLVRIISGPFKGYQGVVVDTDKDTAKVELSSKAKIISVSRSMLEDALEKHAVKDLPAQMQQVGSKTPAYCTQSPQWVDSTPAPQSPGYAGSSLWNNQKTDSAKQDWYASGH